ncbi:MAG: hypothetical protein A2161_21970 [Candidatus Schekmanbacteria bacterium RBG_13_48_7]|uniref:Uncharacterized protein n=1 Tax=Candidatus Schekmanbacteria bacterium RBG_13_48_7 TaxID=1817878 RepID=A0A1F7RYR4_9BACT|nr:MAG: hypothetical protein A2161_21970 [Candidatus Schekmanbacteria bacterium RBG_13_48_7]
MDCDQTHFECRYFEDIAGSKIGVCINKEGQKFFGDTSFYSNDSICMDGQPCPAFKPKTN